MDSLSQRRCICFFLWIWLRHPSNHACGVTKPNEAPYETTGNIVELQELIALKFSVIIGAGCSKKTF